MTDTLTAIESDDFWARVRAALAAIQPARKERVPAYGHSAIAQLMASKPQTGTRIDHEIEQAWADSADEQVPMSLVIVEIDRMSDYFTAYGKDANDACVRAVMQTIANALPRDEHMCLRMGGHRFVIALPDMPLKAAKSNAAKIAKAVRKLGRAHKESHAGIVTASVGFAVVDPEGDYDKGLFTAAMGALKKAQRKGLGRMHGVDLRPAQERRRRKLAA